MARSHYETPSRGAVARGRFTFFEIAQMDAGRQLAHSQEMSNKVALLFQKRAKIAQEHFTEQLKSACDDNAVGQLLTNPAAAAKVWTDWYELRRRRRAALGPVLGHAAPARQQLPRARERGTAAGAALRLRDGGRRPHARAAGQLRAGAHRAARGRDGRSASGARTSSSIRAPATAPASAASRTTRRSAWRCARATRSTSSSSSATPSRARRCSTSATPSSSSCSRCASCIPTAPKPAIVGNCQGGWAAMMLAAADPDDTGPIVINGAPMSYWGGAWQRRRGRQPDALCRRPARRHLARVAHRRPGRRQVRRRLPGAELREPESRQHVLGQVLPPVRQRRHRAAALPRVRALVGRLLPDEPRGDRVDHANLFVGNKLWSGDVEGGERRAPSTCATIKVADHPVRVDGRQHHAAAAGVQLGRRRLRQHRGDQGARPGDRRPAARGHRPPRHLRVRQGREEGARADRLGAEVDRGAAAGPVRHADQRAQGRRRQGRVRSRASTSAGSRTSSRG